MRPRKTYFDHQQVFNFWQKQLVAFFVKKKSATFSETQNNKNRNWDVVARSLFRFWMKKKNSSLKKFENKLFSFFVLFGQKQLFHLISVCFFSFLSSFLKSVFLSRSFLFLAQLRSERFRFLLRIVSVYFLLNGRNKTLTGRRFFFRSVLDKNGLFRPQFLESCSRMGLLLVLCLFRLL